MLKYKIIFREIVKIVTMEEFNQIRSPVTLIVNSFIYLLLLLLFLQVPDLQYNFILYTSRMLFVRLSVFLVLDLFVMLQLCQLNDKLFLYKQFSFRSHWLFL